MVSLLPGFQEANPTNGDGGDEANTTVSKVGACGRHEVTCSSRDSQIWSVTSRHKHVCHFTSL